MKVKAMNQRILMKEIGDINTRKARRVGGGPDLGKETFQIQKIQGRGREIKRKNMGELKEKGREN